MTDVRYMVCCHLGLGLPTGTIACRSGFLATSKYAVDFLGTESLCQQRTAEWKECPLAAASASLALHGIGAHSGGWFSLNVGVLKAGESQVIVPGKATIERGYWADRNEIHDDATDRVRQVIKGSAETWGVVAEQRLIGRAPISSQSETLAKVTKDCAQGIPELTEARDWVESRVAEDGNVFLAPRPSRSIAVSSNAARACSGLSRRSAPPPRTWKAAAGCSSASRRASGRAGRPYPVQPAHQGAGVRRPQPGSGVSQALCRLLLRS